MASVINEFNKKFSVLQWIHLRFAHFEIFICLCLFIIFENWFRFILPGIISADVISIDLKEPAIQIWLVHLLLVFYAHLPTPFARRTIAGYWLCLFIIQPLIINNNTKDIT